MLSLNNIFDTIDMIDKQQKPGAFSLGQLVKKVPLGFFAKLLSELQNQFLYHDFAILPLRRVI